MTTTSRQTGGVTTTAATPVTTTSRQSIFSDEFRGTWFLDELIITISDNKFYMIINDDDGMEFIPVEIILDDTKRDLPIELESVKYKAKYQNNIITLTIFMGEEGAEEKYFLTIGENPDLVRSTTGENGNVPDEFRGKWKSTDTEFRNLELLTTFYNIIIEKNLFKMCTVAGALEIMIDENNLNYDENTNSIEITTYFDDEKTTIDNIYIITINNNELQLSTQDSDAIHNYIRNDDFECPSIGDVLGFNFAPNNLKVGRSYKLFNVNTNSIERILSLSYEEFLETNQTENYNYTDEFGNEYTKEKVYFPQKFSDEYDIENVIERLTQFLENSENSEDGEGDQSTEPFTETSTSAPTTTSQNNNNNLCNRKTILNVIMFLLCYFFNLSFIKPKKSRLFFRGIE